MRALPSLLAFLAALALHLNVYRAQAAEDTSRVGVVDKVENEAQVISASGAVTATGVMLGEPGQGIDIPSPLDPPGAPTTWPAGKVARAIATVALH